MDQLLLLATSFVLTLAGRSPSADYIDDIVRKSGMNFSDSVIEDAKIGIEDLAAKYGYPFESYTVVTEDDYILALHRIPHGRYDNQTNTNKTVAFLMHGLLASSTSYLVLGPENSLAYLLADAGYDVWLGNGRGNYFSRHHKTMDPDKDKDFWRFSWDQIGFFDLPAFLDFIEDTTGQKQLHYIGHSQGCTSFFVLNTLKPEYNEKFISFQGMAPAALFQHNSAPLTKLAPLEWLGEPIFFTFLHGEVFANLGFSNWFSRIFCYKGSLLSALCDNVLVNGVSATSDKALTPVLLGHAPAGASILQFTHYGQCINSKKFRRYNHNLRTNNLLYGSLRPPNYNVTLITAPSYLYCARNDSLAKPEDVQELASQMSNLIDINLVNSTAFDHVDFVSSKYVKQLVYDRLIWSLGHAETINSEKT